MFSVGRESMSGVFVLAVVVNSGQDGVSASVVCERLDAKVSSVELLHQEVGDVLRALERQGLVEQDGVLFVATQQGCERVEAVVGDVLRVSDGERAGDGASRDMGVVVE